MKGVNKLDIKSNLEMVSLKVCFELVHVSCIYIEEIVIVTSTDFGGKLS